MKFYKQKFIIVSGLMFLIVMSGIAAFQPERCNMGPEFMCNIYEARSSDGSIRIQFTNNVGQTVNSISIVNASWALETVGPSNCNDISANTYRAGDIIEVICYFNKTQFPPKGEKMKFHIEMTYLTEGKTDPRPLYADIFVPLDEDYPYTSNKYVFRSSGFIIYMIFTLILLALYVKAIISVGKLKKIKMWNRTGLRAYFAGAIVILLIFTFFIIKGINDGNIESLEPGYYSIGAFLISIIFAIVIYLPVTLVSYVIHKNKKKVKGSPPIEAQ